MPENVRKRLKESNRSKDRLNRISPPNYTDRRTNASISPRPNLKPLFACRRSIEIPAERHAVGNKADEGMAASGFRNRLLGNRLSVLAEACQVIFLRCIWFFDGHSLVGEIVIGCVGIENRWRQAGSQCAVHA